MFEKLFGRSKPKNTPEQITEKANAYLADRDAKASAFLERRAAGGPEYWTGTAVGKPREASLMGDKAIQQAQDAVSSSRTLDRILRATDGVKALQPVREWRDAREYERVNGAANRARVDEVSRFGPGGYKGDPGRDAAERQADRMGDATDRIHDALRERQADAYGTGRRDDIAPVARSNDAAADRLTAKGLDEQVGEKQATYAAERQARAAAYWGGVTAGAPEPEKATLAEAQERRAGMRA